LRPGPQFYDYYAGFYSEYRENLSLAAAGGLSPAPLQFSPASPVCLAATPATSSQWTELPVRLPPDLQSRGASAVTGPTSITIIGEPVVELELTRGRERVVARRGPPPNDPADAAGGGCAVWDGRRERILYVNGGAVAGLGPGRDGGWQLFPVSIAATANAGCAIVKIDGGECLFVAGGAGTGRTAQHLPLAGLQGGAAPTSTADLQASHAWSPALLQLGGLILAVGGVEPSRAAAGWLERWDGHFWTLINITLQDYSLQFRPRLEFVPREYCPL